MEEKEWTDRDWLQAIVDLMNRAYYLSDLRELQIAISLFTRANQSTSVETRLLKQFVKIKNDNDNFLRKVLEMKPIILRVLKPKESGIWN